MIILPADRDHDWSPSDGRCALCGAGVLTAGLVCCGSAAEPEDAWEALSVTLAQIGKMRHVQADEAA